MTQLRVSALVDTNSDWVAVCNLTSRDARTKVFSIRGRVLVVPRANLIDVLREKALHETTIKPEYNLQSRY